MMFTNIYKNACDTYGPRGSSYDGIDPYQSWCLIGIVYSDKGKERAVQGASMNLFAQYDPLRMPGSWRYKVIDHQSGTDIFIHPEQMTGYFNTLANNDIIENIPSKGGQWKVQIVSNPNNIFSAIRTSRR